MEAHVPMNLCVRFYCSEMRLHAHGGRGGHGLPFEAPGLVSVAGEERNRNGVNFFSHSLFSLNLGYMLALDLASQNWYLLQGHPL